MSDEGLDALLLALFRCAVRDLRSRKTRHRQSAAEFLRGAGCDIAQELGADDSAWQKRVDLLTKRAAC